MYNLGCFTRRVGHRDVITTTMVIIKMQQHQHATEELDAAIYVWWPEYARDDAKRRSQSRWFLRLKERGMYQKCCY